MEHDSQHHHHGGHAHASGSPPPPKGAERTPEIDAAVIAAPAIQPAGVIYTCPMHPQIWRSEPGNCPICGMMLEPEVPSAEEEANPELRDFTRRFWLTLPLTILGVAFAMAGHRVLPLAPTAMSWLELALGTPVVLWAGWLFFVRCARSIRHASPNMWTLIGIGVGAAYAFSVVATVAPWLFPAAFESNGRVGVYFEAASVIVSLTLLGQLLELRARSQTSAAIRALLGLQPKPHVGSVRMARKRTSRSPTCTLVTCCAFD